MIANAKQYEVTKQQIERLERQLEIVDTNAHPLVQQITHDGVASLIEELQAELKAYDARARYMCPDCGDMFAAVNMTHGFCNNCREHFKLDDMEAWKKWNAAQE